MNASLLCVYRIYQGWAQLRGPIFRKLKFSGQEYREQKKGHLKYTF
jgi:hypothetical protein